MRPPGRDRRAGQGSARAHRGPRPGAGASGQGAGGNGPHGAVEGAGARGGRGRPGRGQTGRGRDERRGTRNRGVEWGRGRKGTVGGNASRAAPWHQDSPRSAPRPRMSFVTFGSWIFSRFRFWDVAELLDVGQRRKVLVPQLRQTRAKRSSVTARGSPLPLGSRSPKHYEAPEQRCHNFAKPEKDEVSSPHAYLR
jgi:hypothetical protein